MASIVFSVDCRRTRPGEAIFVCGSSELLGSWTPEKALPLYTSKDEFPIWSSDILEIPPAQEVEFKFIVQSENRSGKPIWEGFLGNRKIQVIDGSRVEVRGSFDDAKMDVMEQKVHRRTSKGDAATEEGKAQAMQEQDSILLQMAESGVAVAASEAHNVCPMAVIMEEREPMRRNFSQSLLALDAQVEWKESLAIQEMERLQSPSSQGEAEPDAEVQIVQTPMGSDDNETEEFNTGGAVLQSPAAAGRGVPLQHITSFSALTEMLRAEEKTEARRNSKASKLTPKYEPYNRDVPVVIVTSEIAPWSKTGGLGLVAASYSYEFPRIGHRTMAISPKYKHYDNINYVGEKDIRVNDRDERVKYWHLYQEVAEGRGCDYIFVEHPSIERQGGLYNGDDGREYPDNVFRFTLLSLAAMEAPLHLNINGSKYGDKVLFLANDWQAGLVPLYLCYKYRPNNCYQQSRCIYAVHNLGYQGQYHGIDACRFFGLNQQGASDVGLGNCVNLCKGALICSDRVLTVSPNYAQEIQTPAGGFSLQDFVRAKHHNKRLAGILNGIDDCWNPEIDKDIRRTYSLHDFQGGKKENKEALQRDLGLRIDAGIALIGFVGRLTWQKGVDVIGQIISWLMEDTGNGVTGRVQLIMMGNGERQYADTLRWAERTYPGRVCGYVGFNPKVEHQMMAGCDFLLMPSRYEPCGLPQMCAQLYGTLPIVSATGGLVDSVTDISKGVGEATGFHIAPLQADKMKEVVYKAVEIYLRRPDDFKLMQWTAMKSDFYWPQAMDSYEEQIDKTLYDPPMVR